MAPEELDAPVSRMARYLLMRGTKKLPMIMVSRAGPRQCLRKMFVIREAPCCLLGWHDRPRRVHRGLPEKALIAAYPAAFRPRK